MDGVIRGWRGGSTPADMEYDATALKKLIGRGKAGNVYIGRSFSLAWTGGMFTYDNKMYPIPAAMQPINDFVELELGDVEHAASGADILQIRRIPTTVASAIRCWWTAVSGVLARNSRDTEEIRKAPRTRFKWRTLAYRVLMRGRRAGRDKIIQQEREASQRREVQEARQKEIDLLIAIAAANEAASRARMEMRKTTDPLPQLGEERLTEIVRKAAEPEEIPTRRKPKKSTKHKAAKWRAEKTKLKQRTARDCLSSHWRPPNDEMIEACAARTDCQRVEQHRPTRNQRRMDIAVQESNPTPASFRAQHQAWEIQLACWAGQLGHCGRKTTRARSVQAIQRKGG